MTVREIDRRVLLVHVAVEVGLITCVWSRVGQAARTFHSSEGRHKDFTLLPPKEVQDAEGLDNEHVGKDETRGKRPRGPCRR